MSKTIQLTNGPAKLVTNYKPRKLYMWAELENSVIAEWFGHNYLTEGWDAEYVARFFNYRGVWYDAQEFESAPHDIRRHGFDGWMSQTYFSGIAARYFDAEGEMYIDEIIIAHIHW